MGGNYLLSFQSSSGETLEIKLFNKTPYQANKAFCSLASVMGCGVYEYMELVAVGSNKLPAELRFKKINSAKLNALECVTIDF